MVILAGDIGGTKTHLALFENVQQRNLLKEEIFASKEHQNLEEILRKFLSGSYSVKKACFGIAGPVVNNICRATNLPWVIDGRKLSQSLDMPVFLINDLEANAWGVPCLKKEECFVLNEGDPNLKGNRALISAGTGLGEAGIYWDGKEYHPFACEGGHCNFAPSNEEEIELWRYLKAKFGHVSYESVLCGEGISDIYQFLIQSKKMNENPKIKQLMGKDNPSKVISENAQNGACPACMKSIEMFCSIYGSEAGNTALKFLSTGGLFIGGGIAPKILTILKNGSFMESYLDKGRFKNLLSMIPIKVILNENTALLGAAYYAEKKADT
jgi:glucokinase